MSSYLKLERLLVYHARGVGHTKAALEVAAKSEAFFVTATHQQREMIQRENWPLLKDAKVNIVTLDEVERGCLMGRNNKPIVIDHFALQMLLADTLNIIVDATEAKRRAENENEVLRLQLGKLQVEVQRLEKLAIETPLRRKKKFNPKIPFI